MHVLIVYHPLPTDLTISRFDRVLRPGTNRSAHIEEITGTFSISDVDNSITVHRKYSKGEASPAAICTRILTNRSSEWLQCKSQGMGP
jgi:hypothetical protein